MNEKTDQVERYIQGMKKEARKQALRAQKQKSQPGAGSEPASGSRKARQTDWPEDEWDLDDSEFNHPQRIMPRGEKERRRKLEQLTYQQPEGRGNHAAAAAQATPATKTGLVLEAGSGVCRVEIGNEILFCEIRGNVKEAETGYINPVAAGDRVLVTPLGEQRGVVEAVLPRRSVLARPYMPDQGVMSDLQQIVVANVDQLLVVASWREPFIWPALIDRYLIAASRNRIAAQIVVNKVDLIEDRQEYHATLAPYRALGYPILETSIVSGAGIAELRAQLHGKATVLAGLSGVGKSSLLTAVQPELKLRTAEVSQAGLFTGQGRHTTTQASLWKLDAETVVIDTPGIRSFGLAGVRKGQLASWYPELAELAGACRFGDCAHTGEPGCAVQVALQIGSISELRFKNYQQILAELDD